MKRLIIWSLSQAMLQEAPAGRNHPVPSQASPRKCNAIVTEKTLPRCLMNDMLRSSVWKA